MGRKGNLFGACLVSAALIVGYTAGASGQDNDRTPSLTPSPKASSAVSEQAQGVLPLRSYGVDPIDNTSPTQDIFDDYGFQRVVINYPIQTKKECYQPFFSLE